MNGTDFSAKTGTITGMTLTILVNVSGQQLFETAVVAGVGALASFIISYLLERLMRKNT